MHRVSPRLVQSLVAALKKDPEFLQQAREKELKRRQKLRAVIAEALKHLSSKAGLFKAKQVSESVLTDHGIAVSNQYVCQVLRHDIGARFKLIRKIPYLGNHNRCLMLRQLYAKFMLRKLAAGVRIINVDQTWINDMFLTRRKWRMRGKVNSWAEKPVNPRIAVQMAVCTDGKLYYAMTQVNTDHNVFCLFMSHLAGKLTAEDRDWRKNVILQVDGAKY